MSRLGSLAACAEMGLGDVRYLLGINSPNKCRKEKAGGGAYKSQGADALCSSVPRSVSDGAGVATERLLPTAGMECSPQGSFVHGISQARILEWVAMPFSRESSQPRNGTQVSGTASRFLTV